MEQQVLIEQLYALIDIRPKYYIEDTSTDSLVKIWFDSYEEAMETESNYIVRKQVLELSDSQQLRILKLFASKGYVKLEQFATGSWYINQEYDKWATGTEFVDALINLAIKLVSKRIVTIRELKKAVLGE